MIAFGPLLASAPLNLSAKRLELALSPKELFVRLQSTYRDCYLLESAKGKSRLAEYSFLGFEPDFVATAKDGRMELEGPGGNSKDRVEVDDPLEELKRMVRPNSVSGLFRFIGGAVGYASYDSVRYWEEIPRSSVDDLGLPDMQFGIYTDGVVFDHARREAYYYTLGKSRLEEVLDAAKGMDNRSPTRASEPKANVPQERFEENVLKAKEHIEAGDIFQVVLSKRHDMEVEGDLTGFYEALSEVNPSPYMYFLKFGDRRIVGSSPEMLVRVEDGRIETYPIAGTRPRVEDEAENARLRKELAEDPKEVAEHVMLVDLARNDIGRVSRYGSVKVPELMSVEQYSHVQHMVTHVVGELRSGCDSYDALRAVFPAGTVSGAPKVRAMEIVEELEGRRRGPYAGAVGYFSFNGNADFAITIRTLVADGSKASVQAGAGIVADSVPATEWRESEAKARGLLSAMKLAEERSA
ncbi:MAG: anthranilate synthase component I [archaeon]|nr:MAG: anthranilate synthase component I [archaeon]